MKSIKKKSPKEKIITYLEYLTKQPQGFAYKEQKVKKQPTTPPNKEKLLNQLFFQYQNCQSCPLATQGRTNIVFGQGNHNAKLMFVGEGPGRDEDLQALPFIGRAGKLLTKIINAMNLKREDIYITNVVKCRPPNNRAPLPEESNTCKSSILFKEIEIVNPKIICTLGASATQAILGDDSTISKTRGIFFQLENKLVIPTFHPAYLLRNPSAKRLVWEDMQKILKKLEE